MPVMQVLPLGVALDWASKRSISESQIGVIKLLNITP